MTPAEIKKTRLYRTLAPCVRKEDREELARMLAMVPEPENEQRGFIIGFSSTSLDRAFWWDETPQGGDYWNELYVRLSNAGHPY